MTLRRASSGLALLTLAACAATSVKEVSLHDQAQYWLVDRASLRGDVPAEDGCFRAKVTIGADGKVTDPKVLAVVGQQLSAWLPAFLAQLRFQPAPENPGRIPIRTILTWTLTHTVETTTVSAASAAAAMKAAAAVPPPTGDGAWNKTCQAAMDQQMGITP